MFIIFSIAYNHQTKKSLTFLAIALVIISTGPLVAYYYVEEEFKRVEFKSITFRQLVYSDGAVLRGFLVNRSEKILRDCKVEGKLFNKTDSAIKRFIYLIKPKSKTTVLVEGTMYPNEVLPFELKFNGVTYSDDVDMSLRTMCR